MKPIDETWSVDHGDIVTSDGDCVFEQSYTGESPNEDERRQLASAAPDMARVLLSLSIERHDETGRRLGCAACGADIGIEPHTSDCALDAALRKAGVR